MDTKDLDAFVQILRSKESDCKTPAELDIVRELQVSFATYLSLTYWYVDASRFVALCRKGVTIADKEPPMKK